MTVSTTQADSFGDINGTVANAKSGVTYELEYSLSMSVRVREQLALATNGAFTAIAPAGAINVDGEYITGPVSLKLLEVAANGAVTELTAATVNVAAVSMPSDAVLGDATLLYAKVHLAMAEDIRDRKNGWSFDGFDLFPDYSVAAETEFYNALIFGTEAIRAGAPEMQLILSPGSVPVVITAAQLAILDLHFYRLLQIHPPPIPLPQAVVSTAEKSRSLSAIQQKWDLTDVPSWSRALTDDVRTNSKRIAAAVGITVGVARIVLAGAAVPAAVVSASAFITIVATTAAVTLAIDAFTSYIDKGEAGWNDAAPTAKYVGESVLSRMTGTVLKDFTTKLCGENCGIATTIGRGLVTLFSDAQSATQARYDDGTFPTEGTQSRGVLNIEVTASPEVNPLTPTIISNALITVRFTPLTLTQPVTIRLGAKDPITGEWFYNKEFRSTDTFQVRIPVTPCRANFLIVAHHVGGSLTRGANFFASNSVPACDSGGGTGAIDEFVAWRVGAGATSRTTPYGKDLRIRNGTLNFSVSAIRSGNPDDDEDISIFVGRLVRGATTTFDSATTCMNTNEERTPEAMVTYPNPPYEQRFFDATGEIVKYDMTTCNYVERHLTPAGTLVVNSRIRPMADNPQTVFAEAGELIVSGTFDFIVGDHPFAETNSIFIGNKRVQGSFQFNAGICYQTAATNQVFGMPCD